MVGRGRGNEKIVEERRRLEGCKIIIKNNMGRGFALAPALCLFAFNVVIWLAVK